MAFGLVADIGSLALAATGVLSGGHLRLANGEPSGDQRDAAVRLPSILPRALLLGLALIMIPLANAAGETRPVVGPGATKDDVIKAYGWPNGQSQSGTKEILSYSQGDVTLENGRVERVNFSPDVPWQAPRPRPGPPTASTRKVPEVPVNYWLTSFDAALADAQKRNARVLALFTGSDWSPASRQFQDEVEHDPDFVNAFAGDFVLLRLDYPRGNPVPAVISEENLRIRDRYHVTTYPSLLVLSPSGDLLGRVDLAAPREGLAFRERVIAAVREARQASAGRVPLKEEPAAATPSGTSSRQPGPSAGQQGGVASEPTAPAMMKAGKVIFLALVAGGALVLFVLWRLWRRPNSQPAVPVLDIADRIDSAAGGMPLSSEMAGWSKDKLRAVVARLAEFDDYSVRLRPAKQDIDMELRKRSDVQPRVLVCCAPGSDGIVAPKQLRELFASLAAEGVENGWYISPAGFSAECRAYAAAHRIVLVGSEGLHSMMHNVPPVSLPSVLAAE